MKEQYAKDSFDKLVAGLDSQDRALMLNRINQSASPTVQFIEEETEILDEGFSLQLKYQSESLFYKLIVWLRSFIFHKEKESIYNSDIVASIARRLSRSNPGILNHHIYSLDSVFYNQLVELNNAVSFFKEYLYGIEENPGAFYVFLSTFVAPELSDEINNNADPFINPFTKEPNIEVRNSLIRSLDSILDNISGGTKKNLYSAIKLVNWILCFSRIPVKHMLNQFTNIAGDVYSCPYRDIVKDFDILASVFDNIATIPNEILEAIYLYSHRSEVSFDTSNVNLERGVKEFLAKANSNLAKIQIFRMTVPVHTVGKVVHMDYNWLPQEIGGVEDWFSSFRAQWKKIIEIRWNEWLRERRKDAVRSLMEIDFGLKELPMLKNRPWTNFYANSVFSYEMSSGFIYWFATNKFDDIMPVLNEVMMEGIFNNNENRSEYAEKLSLFVQANNYIITLVSRLSPDGDFGTLMKNQLTQNQLTSLINEIESGIQDAIEKIKTGCSGMELIFHGFYDEDKDGIHDRLTNWFTIKGRKNRLWRENLLEIREMLKNYLRYVTELVEIDLSVKQSKKK